MSTSLNWAIIGCGKIAVRHAEQAARYGKLIAVCDIVREKAEQLAGPYNAKVYTSAEELFQKEPGIDVAAICTPNGLHAQHSILALKAGKDVLCEKPLCIHSHDAAGIIKMAEQSGRKLFVVKSTRYNPALISLKHILNEQKAGRLYSFQLNCFWNRPAAYYANTWKGKLEMDGGTLYTQFSHYIDALLWLLGDIKSVTGIRKNLAHQYITEFEDSGVVAMEMENGMIGGLNWSVNTYQKNMEVSLTIMAEKGSIRIGGEYMNKVEYQLADGFSVTSAEEGAANDYGFYQGSMSNHDKVYENLVIALENPSHPFSNAQDGLKTVEAIERIYKSVSLS